MIRDKGTIKLLELQDVTSFSACIHSNTFRADHDATLRSKVDNSCGLVMGWDRLSVPGEK